MTSHPNVSVVNASLPRSRRDARARGVEFYFIAVPCPRGHLCKRRVSNANCVACEASYRAQRAAAIAETRKKNRAKQKVWNAQWKARNAARVVSKRKSHYAANGEHIREKSKAWRRANPEKAAAISRNKEARKRAAPGRHSAADIAEIRRLQRDRCAEPSCRCRLRGAGHIDHIIPLARGGHNDRRNLQFLCGPCNMHKHAKDPIEFARELGRLL
jgi:5-methylcytosine-specific restriction endonuclease McrA